MKASDRFFFDCVAVRQIDCRSLEPNRFRKITTFRVRGRQSVDAKKFLPIRHLASFFGVVYREFTIANF
jgi:hypothetical protein